MDQFYWKNSENHGFWKTDPPSEPDSNEVRIIKSRVRLKCPKQKYRFGLEKMGGWRMIFFLRLTCL